MKVAIWSLVYEKFEIILLFSMLFLKILFSVCKVLIIKVLPECHTSWKVPQTA